MASERTPRAGTPAVYGAGRRPNNTTLIDAGVDSDDDDEEGGTSLADSAAATPPPDDINAASSRRNGDQGKRPHESIIGIPNSLFSLPKGKFKATRALDWFLGRNLPLSPEDSTYGLRSRGRAQEQSLEDDYFDIGDVKDMCPACTTPYCQAVDSIPFKSSLKLMYNDAVSQKWLIGNRYILREEVDGRPEDEYVPLVEALRALKTLAPNIPTAKVRAGWKENGKVITICDTVPGERLYDIWWDLTNDERENIAKQVAQYIEGWRGTDLSRISSLIGGPVYHHANLFGATDSGFGPFGSDLELWQAIERRLKKQRVPEDTIQVLRDHMPSSSPCVFTHGDLSSANIIVHEGSVSAITGFENAASLPVWAEDVAMHFCSCPEDEQWKALLSRHTRSYRAALDWWSFWTAVEDATEHEGKSARKVENLKMRCERWKSTEIHGEPFWSIWLGHEAGGGAALKRLNIQTVENKVEVRLGDLVRQAVAPELLRQRMSSYEDISSDTSWGSSSSFEEEEGGDDENMPRQRTGRRGLTPLHSIQQQHHTLVTSANGPPHRVVEEALSRGGRVGRKTPPTLRSLTHYGEEGEMKRNDYCPAPVPNDFSDTEESDSDTASSAGGAPSYEEVLSNTKGLRPLSLPTIALSESARNQLRRAGEDNKKCAVAAGGDEGSHDKTQIAIREDGDGETPGSQSGEEKTKEKKGEGGEGVQTRAKRTSMYKSGAAPGSFYAVLSAASTETRPKRWSDGGGGEGNVRMDASRLRPKSMLQPSVRHEGDKDKQTGVDEERDD